MKIEKILLRIKNLFLRNLDNYFYFKFLNYIFNVIKCIKVFEKSMYFYEKIKYLIFILLNNINIVEFGIFKWLNLLELLYIIPFNKNIYKNNLVIFNHTNVYINKPILLYYYIVNKCNNNSKIKVLKMNINKNKRIFKIENLILNKKILLLLKYVLCNNNNSQFYINANANNTEFELYKISLNKIIKEWRNVKWIISFKFNTTFTNDHINLLLSYFKNYIKDEKFIDLLKFLFDNKILDIGYFKSISRSSYDDKDELSNLFINIIFSKLDKKINELNNDLFVNCYGFKNIFNNILYSKIKFVRSSNSFIIGINCNKLEAIEIKNEINHFLNTKIYLNNVCSYITNVNNDNLKFLNIKISSGLNRFNIYSTIVLTSRYLIFKVLINLGILNKKRKPIYISYLLKFDINTIINTYIIILYFIISSFYICQNFSVIYKYIYIFIFASLMLTLQVKLNAKINNINTLFKLGLINFNIYRSFFLFHPKNLNIFKIKLICNDLSFLYKNIDWEHKIYIKRIVLEKNYLNTEMFTRKSLLHSKIIIINKNN